MSEDEIGFTILGVIFAMAILAAIVAAIKNRSAFGWFIGTLIFPPILLLVLFLPSKRGDKSATSGNPDVPSWAQPASIERDQDSPDDVQSALQRAETRTDNQVSKRILQMAARAAKRAEQRQQRDQKSRRERPRREQRERPERPARTPTVEPAEIRQAASAASVRKVTDRSRQPRRGAVQRSGTRETVIYRRT